MVNNLPPYLRGLRAEELANYVAQVIHVPDARLVEWEIMPLGGGSANYAEGGLGVFRVQGRAQRTDSVLPWSLVAKGASSENESGGSDPAAHNYWKRETLVYQSGILEKLPPGIVSPRCFAVVEPTPQEAWLWLEEIQEDAQEWSLQQYGTAARGLGRFNGAYLAGHPLPEWREWMNSGRVRGSLARKEIQIYPSPESAKLPYIGELAQLAQLDRMEKFLAQRQQLLIAWDKLPRCFCHHDAFRRNLLARTRAGGEIEIVAIDWAFSGIGCVGEEAGFFARMNSLWMDVAAADARPLFDVSYTAYVEGLAEAGWQGDEKLVRYGYTLSAAMGSTWPLSMMRFLPEPGSKEIAEEIVGHPLDAQIKHLAQLQPLYLELADEAVALAASI
jgi:hypothetical protein